MHTHTHTHSSLVILRRCCVWSSTAFCSGCATTMLAPSTSSTCWTATKTTISPAKSLSLAWECLRWGLSYRCSNSLACPHIISFTKREWGNCSQAPAVWFHQCIIDGYEVSNRPVCIHLGPSDQVRDSSAHQNPWHKPWWTVGYPGVWQDD